MIKKAQKPIIYFEATGIYSRVIEHFCETNGLRFCRLNPLELHLKSESLRRVKTDQKDAHRIALTVQENDFSINSSLEKRLSSVT
jgi:Transposase.